MEFLFADPRWLVDESPSGAWFAHALDLDWTRDPFDHLLVAHASLRGWELATAMAGRPRVFFDTSTWSPVDLLERIGVLT